MVVQQLAYVSAAAQLMPSHELAELLAHARKKNARLGVTGILLHDAGSFLQVIEGAPATVDALFRTIEADPRHQRVVVLGREPVSRAAFGAWHMGFVDRADPELAALPGFKDLSGAGFDAGSLTEVKNRAHYLIEAFSVGRLRQFVAG
jgi:hypothetical protein